MNSLALARGRFVLAQLRALQQWRRADQEAFIGAVRELPALVRTNGLGQTLAYLKGKDDAGARAMYRTLTEWLCGVPDADRLECILRDGDPFEVVVNLKDLPHARATYMAATESVWRLCEWLKPLAVSYLPSGGRAQPSPGDGSEASDEPA